MRSSKRLLDGSYDFKAVHEVYDEAEDEISSEMRGRQHLDLSL